MLIFIIVNNLIKLTSKCISALMGVDPFLLLRINSYPVFESSFPHKCPYALPPFLITSTTIPSLLSLSRRKNLVCTLFLVSPIPRSPGLVNIFGGRLLLAGGKGIKCVFPCRFTLLSCCHALVTNDHLRSVSVVSFGP